MASCPELVLDETALDTTSTRHTHVAVAGPDALISRVAAIGIEKTELGLALSPFDTVKPAIGVVRRVVWCGVAVLVCLKGLYSKSVPPNLAVLPNVFKH